MLNETKWEYSTEEPSEEYVAPVEGEQYLIIKKAERDKDTNQYVLFLSSLTNGAFFSIRYYLDSVNKETGEVEPDARQRRTLITLKRALYGPEAVGIPHPDDIVGCAVMAEVKMSKPNAEGKQYARIYGFSAVPADIALEYGNPEQYMLPVDEE